MVRGRRTAVLMAFDAVALLAAYLVTIVVRYDVVTGAILRDGMLVACAAVTLQWGVGLVGRLYLGRVGVATNEETILLSCSTTVAGILVFVANASVDPQWVARSVPMTGTFLGIFMMLTTRALWRRLTMRLAPMTSAAGSRAVIVGAGGSGARLVHSMRSHPDSGLLPVGFLDDDPWMRNRRHFGVPVLGTVDDLERVVASTGATAVVVAIPSASKETIKPLVDRAADLGITIKVLPPFAESFASHADVRDVRDVNMTDILRRAAVETDVAAIAGYVTGKRVLVTGAGGSIGSELCRQLHRYGPAELIMLDRDESALHAVQLSIHGRALLDSPDVVLNDIRDATALRQIFQDRRPEVVFHAAALKHLPMLEQYPHEAMKTNVLGTSNVLRAARDVGVTTFVNISTDKAADPTSVLGYSKRVAERLTAAVAQESEGAYISVRFGNVLGSRGSVLHTFTSQIASGGPVTVVHPEVTRYFMTVEEAVQLVVQAGAIGEDGEVMILDMGEPVKIVDVARQLIAMSGKNVDIVYTGLREGEKLHEILFGGAESDERSKHPLVSHSVVSPLSTNVVHSFDLEAPHSDVLEAFEDWVHLPDPAATHR
ncbi:FlaA1/EpsC-like NDP-sugar epimerase [Nocardioides sp. BE266]|uniref:polysaccharide biosynthesis protein n=1 Tax=Nocardioides sp. BE266 TaxID=2817725 RepID=UPI002857A9DB|nr:nucleoside-diphosphate sugar epimerase/dehydratase [Nocardioides sp. BE266]MDR7252072.1 FlaA1/EpsC-like NDP-sugar epimerase [Nocardioides sp. BE266]